MLSRHSGRLPEPASSTFLALPGTVAGVEEEAVQRLRQYVARARAERGIRDNTQLAEASGVKYRTLVNVLAGKPSRATVAVELALGWQAGSFAAVLDGGEPTVTPQNPRSAPETAAL